MKLYLGTRLARFASNGSQFSNCLPFFQEEAIKALEDFAGSDDVSVIINFLNKSNAFFGSSFRKRLTRV